MSLKGEDLNIFTHLGLTPRQAEVYLTICKLEKATVKTCAKRLQIARAEVYRAIPELQKRGLIKKIISTPIAFRATPLSEGLKILLQENAEKHEDVCRQAKQFLRNFSNNNREKTSQEDTQYNLTVGLKAVAYELLRILKKLQNSFDCIIHWKQVLFGAERYFGEIKEASEKGVKMRIITNIPENAKIPQNIRTLIKTDPLEIKYASVIPRGTIGIYDKKSVRIATMRNDNLNEIEVLWLHNSAIVELTQDYFDMKWQSATTPCWHNKNHQIKT